MEDPSLEHDDMDQVLQAILECDLRCLRYLAGEIRHTFLGRWSDMRAASRLADDCRDGRARRSRDAMLAQGRQTANPWDRFFYVL